MTLSLTRGAARVLIGAGEVQTLRTSGVLVEDPRRERPRYFDGRFLAARDLIRDQQYMLTREADLARTAGSGVGNGLLVDAGPTPQSLRISAGQGVTPAGELVRLPHDLDLNLADIPLAEQLSAHFGLSRIPVAPLRSRTGLFVLALRPVEFTANPIGAYPTSLTGARSVEDGDVIEATALVLVPWQEDGAADAPEARRGRAARIIFTQSQQTSKTATSANVLPIAMLALQSNSIVWIDEAMVRRELGADRGDLPGLGFAPRALRLAHLMQHQTHLAEVVAQLGGRSFSAASQFAALPPAGPLPPGTINTRDFTQRYFPAEVDVDFSIIPDDELPALVEESLALPPIDLLASDAVLDLTAVLVLAPVPRGEFRSVLARLESRTRTLKAVAPNLIAQRKPLDILQRLRLPLPIPLPDISNPADAEWARLARLPTLWYVRRRNLAYRDDLAGTPVAVAGGNELLIERSVRDRIATLGLSGVLDNVLLNASPKAVTSTLNLLGSPRLVASPALTAATLGALVTKVEAQPATGDTVSGGTGGTPTTTAVLDQARVLAVAADLAKPNVGDGLTRLEQSTSTPLDTVALTEIAKGTDWRVLDSAALTASKTEVPTLTTRLTTGVLKTGTRISTGITAPIATRSARNGSKPA
ncbi:hypothetical protein Lcho_3051 [Leptothrix cholodnii SP-6]|uniref:Uncharacterized protein n=1 Tax=Leptothrix cholodnii (strain ATCC 51168 / LMG 8142 / SP-6) TaxID=395495 RepID=B1Y030_LEPCP|nr:hypothetical protein [Leptothrix cholodnii]ACB35311.1 hypothetical protein Lcho_3051 [Leptothrix cholodnii SP-6]